MPGEIRAGRTNVESMECTSNDLNVGAHAGCLEPLGVFDVFTVEEISVADADPRGG
jgi:hypothetical protein